MKRKLNKKQQGWCEAYEHATAFEPLMDDYLGGNESFEDAAVHSIEWFRDYFEECMRSIPRIPK